MFDKKIKRQIEKKILKLNQTIIAIESSIFFNYPIEFYVNDVKSYIGARRYNYLSPRLIQFFHSISSCYDSHVLSLFHKLSLLFLMKESIEGLLITSLPRNILDMYHDRLARILRDFSKQPDDFYNHQNDLFLKDLALCSLRLIPVGGSWLTEVSGIGRKFLVSGGVRQFLSASVFVLFKARGLRPFFQIHMDSRNLNGFNPQGRDQCYLGIAELLQLNPHVKGMYAVSWFYDPVLERISPNLLFLREEPEQNGARVFRIGTSNTDIKNATAKSAKRRKLYHEGKYLPTSYLLIWPKTELLSWANKRTQKSDNQLSVDHTAATRRGIPENRA